VSCENGRGGRKNIVMTDHANQKTCQREGDGTDYCTIHAPAEGNFSNGNEMPEIARMCPCARYPFENAWNTNPPTIGPENTRDRINVSSFNIVM
jgi:hypothetical protein